MVGSSSDNFIEEETSYGMNFAPDDDLLSFFQSLEDVGDFPIIDDDAIAIRASFKEFEETAWRSSHRNTSSAITVQQVSLERETELETSLERKRPILKHRRENELSFSQSFSRETNTNGDQKRSHIAVERNRRKQMNDHLSVLKSLLPSFYVQKGDQASIVGGVVSYINELEQILKTLEGKKKRKINSKDSFLNPSSRASPLLSPRTPQKNSSSYQLPWLHKAPGYVFSDPSNQANSVDPSPSSSSSTSSSFVDGCNELFAATSKSALAEVEVRFTGPNLLLKTVSSSRFPGQVLKIMAAIEDLSLEILHLTISTDEDTTVNTFTIKIGIECKISAEELAYNIQHTFC